MSVAGILVAMIQGGRHGLRAALMAVVVSSMTAVAHVQEPSDPPDFLAWVEAVNTHVPGASDDALVRVAPSSRADLDALLPRVSRVRPADRVRLVERALVLHTDIAMAYRVPGGYRDLPPGRGTATLFLDGQALGEAAGTYHWEFARRLIERLPRGDDRLRIGRQFYRATAALLQSWIEYAELFPHLGAARRVLGDDAVLLMYEGTMHQANAGPRMQRFFEDRQRVSRGAGAVTTGRVESMRSTLPSPSEPSTATNYLMLAERLFRRAIEIDPTLAEARIRLAHVLSDRGRHDAAAAELAQVVETPLPPRLDYYASLIAGRVARARADFDAARLAFERAAAIYPEAPAPRYGLSELAVARGDRAQGLEYLLRVNMTERVNEHEPWWQLERVHEPTAQELIDEMRRAVSP